MQKLSWNGTGRSLLLVFCAAALSARFSLAQSTPAPDAAPVSILVLLPEQVVASANIPFVDALTTRLQAVLGPATIVRSQLVDLVHTPPEIQEPALERYLAARYADSAVDYVV